MDRTIIFRGKSILTGKLVYGDLLMHRAPMEICIEQNKVVQVERGTIDQYAGFRDKHQYFVFDHDILAVDGKNHPYLIQFMDNWCGFYLMPVIDEKIVWNKPISVRGAKRQGINIMAFDDTDNIEVVGNLHDFEAALVKFDIWFGKQQEKL